MPSFHWYLYAANHRNIDMVNYTAEPGGIEQKMTSDNPSSCHLPLLKYIYIHRTYVQHTNIYFYIYIYIILYNCGQTCWRLLEPSRSDLSQVTTVVVSWGWFSCAMPQVCSKKHVEMGYTKTVAMGSWGTLGRLIQHQTNLPRALGTLYTWPDT